MSVIIRGQTTIKTKTLVNAGPVVNGLVGQWLLNGNVNDSSASGYNGSAVGSPTYGAGVSNVTSGSIALNGTSQYVSLSAVPNNLYRTALSVGGWIRRNGAQPGDFGAIMCQGSYFAITQSDFPINFSVTASTNLLGVNLGAGGSWTAAVSVNSGAVTVPDATWTHVFFTFLSSGSTILYINGVQVGSASSGGITLSTPTSPWLIGYMTGNSGGAGKAYFKGSMSDMRMYNRQLTAAEVALIAAGNG